MPRKRTRQEAWVRNGLPERSSPAKKKRVARKRTHSYNRNLYGEGNVDWHQVVQRHHPSTSGKSISQDCFMCSPSCYASPSATVVWTARQRAYAEGHTRTSYGNWPSWLRENGDPNPAPYIRLTLRSFKSISPAPYMQAAPSPFAALLRRSKFASYDQAIGQVYTTHGGHAFRGDWGFKRPLANRRRSGFITVQSVDSPEQQTEWSSAEGSTRWMRRWEELGKKLEVGEMTPWRSRVGPGEWKIDTEFDVAGKKRGFKSSPKGSQEENSHSGLPYDSAASSATPLARDVAEMGMHGSIPNPEAMSPKQFQKYLDHLRAVRPEFKLFVKDYWLARRARLKRGPQLKSEREQLLLTGSGDVNMLLSAQTAPDKLVSEFLKRQNVEELKSSTSTRVDPRPHPLAGLEYTPMSMLQSKYLHKPAPGRHIGTNRAARYQYSDIKPKYDLIAVGGIIGSTSLTSHNMVPTDFGTRETPRTDRERGKALFRLSKVVLVDPPHTVGRWPQRAMDTKLTEVDFRLAQTSNLSNPHPLGSPEYVNQINDVTSENSTGSHSHHPIPVSITNLSRHAQPPSPEIQGETKVHSAALLDKLSAMLPKTPASSDENSQH